MKKIILTWTLILSSISAVAQSNEHNCQNVDPDAELSCEIAKATIKRNSRMVEMIINSVTHNGLIEQTWLSNLVESAKKENKQVITETVSDAIKRQTTVSGLTNLLTDLLDKAIPVLYYATPAVKQITAVRTILKSVLTQNGLVDEVKLGNFLSCAGFNYQEIQGFISKYKVLTKEQFQREFTSDFAWGAPKYAKQCVR